MKSASGNLSGISFEKYDKLEFKSAFDEGLLFMPDMRDAVVKHICPYCQRKLYDMRDKPLAYCKNKLHKRFVIAKSKLL